MNNGRMWCVVNPTVGLPLFFGAVALTSLTVHSALMTNTTWMKDFYNGNYKATASVDTGVSPVALKAADGASDFVINVAPAAGSAGNGAASFVVTVTPKTPAAAKPGDLALAVTTAK